MSEEAVKREVEAIKKSENTDTKARKLITIFVTSLLLLIPIGLMKGIINDRMNYNKGAIDIIEQSWATSQTIELPKMSFATKNAKNENVVNNLELNNYQADVVIKTEIRKKGIFKVPVYTAEVTQKGDFKNKYGNLSGKNITTTVNVSEARGFITGPTFKINNATPQKSSNVSYTTDLKTGANLIPFEITYKIKGLHDIKVILGGLTNKISIKGNWKDPGFQGSFLPEEKEITSKDFSASWSVPKVALQTNYGQEPHVSVLLFVPVDNYSMAEKALKYGYLLLVLTFAGYFVFEITSKEQKRVHPVQYCLLGAAMLMFYMLLVSISELLTFNAAYLISALMVISLIAAYTYFVITKRKSLIFSIGITALLAILYAYFYTLLILSDISLFAGSTGMFFIIALIMYLTRNVNWYGDEK